MRELDITTPLDIRQLCARLGQHRGRPIELVPHEFPGSGVFGLWLSTRDRDLVLFERQTTAAHQQHIILHELGHIVLDHGVDGDDESAWRTLFPTLPVDVVRRALCRSSYEAACEYEAELFASVITGWAGLIAALDELPTASTGLAGAFDDPRGWL